MRILYLDIDSLRPDHLGCYGYHRDTSPTIDRIAAQGVRFANCHASDVPCLPSRTSLFCGRFGIHSGVVNHGGSRATPFNEGPSRGFRSQFFASNWMNSLADHDYHTATISPFGERHSAYHWYAGFREIINPGGNGNATADETNPHLLDWLDRRGSSDNWFLHVNFWDPHTPYRTPDAYGNPFADEPLPDWLTEQVRQQHWQGVGPHSAREVLGFGSRQWELDTARDNPRQPATIPDMDGVRAMFDGYDTGIRFTDDHLALVLDKLDQLGIRDDTAIILSADHGENLGELNIYGDHQTADQITTHIPLIIHWPGVTDTPANRGRLDPGLLYANDWAATCLELCGIDVPGGWDGRSFATDLLSAQPQGRGHLVVSQGAWSLQRGLCFRHPLNGSDKDWILIRSYHDGYHLFPDLMLFNLTDDPHEQHNLADAHPDITAHAVTLLESWVTDMMRTSPHNEDPFWTVLREGGPLHTKGHLPAYLTRLRNTDRSHHADALEAKHPREATNV